MKMHKMYPKVVYPVILTYFRTPNPQNGPLYYQWSTFRGSYSTKSLHKLVLQENVSNFIIFELKVHLECPKVDFRGQNLENFTLKSLYKLVLPENILISYFSGMEMHKMYPKVEYMVILAYFRTP